MGRGGKALNVQHGQGGVGDGLTKDGLGVGAEGGLQLLVGAVRRDKGHLDAHFGHGDGDEIEGAAVDAGGGDDVIAAGGDVEQGEEVGRLTGGGQHGGGAAFQRGDLGRHVVAGGILEPGVEISVGLQVEELAHVLRGGILEGGGLDNGDLAGFTVAGGVAPLDAKSFGTIVLHDQLLLSRVHGTKKAAFVPKKVP